MHPLQSTNNPQSAISPDEEDGLQLSQLQQQEAQSPPPKPLYRCPDCHKVFKHASGVYIHASQTHYATHLQASHVTFLC